MEAKAEMMQLLATNQIKLLAMYVLHIMKINAILLLIANIMFSRYSGKWKIII